MAKAMLSMAGASTMKLFRHMIEPSSYGPIMESPCAYKGDALEALGRTEESDVAYTKAKGMHSVITATTSPSATPVTHILDHSMASKSDGLTLPESRH